MKKQKIFSIIAVILVGLIILLGNNACSSIDDAVKSVSGDCGMGIGNCLGCVTGGACSACVGCLKGCGDVIEDVNEGLK